MLGCQRCNSDRMVDVDAKTSDMCTVHSYSNWDGTDEPGEVPSDLGIGGGDYISFSYCLECGQIQGDFPLPKTEIEGGEDEPGCRLETEATPYDTTCDYCDKELSAGDQMVVCSYYLGEEKVEQFCSTECHEDAHTD
jgi:hypothetical protein